jgi:hypothetical protein
MRLSVVLTVVDAGEALDRCLASLTAQRNPPEMDIIVPWDDSVPEVEHLAARYPACRFLPMGRVTTGRPPASVAGQHELFDRRRAAGLAAATGDVVAILEDRGVPRPDWAETTMRLHAGAPHAVIGGAIENGRHALLNWAVYFCDFSRYQRPFAAGPREWVSDVNISYKRRALDQTRELWRDRYHETTVHWALQRAGETLYLTPDLVVDQMRKRLRLPAAIGERVAWGRLFAYTRARELTTARRVGLALLAPLLPVLLFARHARQQTAKRVALGTFIRVSPLVFLLLAAWSLGEMLGYLTAEP